MRLAVGRAQEQRQLDRGHLQLAFGIDHFRFARGDQPLVVDPGDTFQVAALHALLDLLDAILGQLQQLPMRLQRLSHRHPIPVNLRSLADEVQQLRLHRRVDGPPRQRGLRYAAAAFVDQPVLQQRHADARREFAAAVRLLFVRVGMEVAAAELVAGEHIRRRRAAAGRA